MKTATAAKPKAEHKPEQAPAPQEKDKSQQVPFDQIPREQKPRMSICINPDGSFDIAALREQTLAKLKEAIRRTPSLTAEAPAVEIPLFPPEVIGGLYNALGKLEAYGVSYFKQIPISIANHVFTYSPQEVAGLTPLTARILDKYSSEWMKKYRDECTLLLMLCTLHIQKFEILAAMMRQSSVVEMPKPTEEEPPNRDVM